MSEHVGTSASSGTPRGALPDRDLADLRDAISSEAGADPFVGRRVGAWRLEAALGAGGFGRVYAAVQVESGLEAAVKVLLPRALDRPGTAERFRRGCTIAARLRHPGLIRVLDGDVEGEVAFVAMARADGGSLAERLEGRGCLRPDEALALVSSIATSSRATSSSRRGSPSSPTSTSCVRSRTTAGSPGPEPPWWIGPGGLKPSRREHYTLENSGWGSGLRPAAPLPR